MLWYVVLMMAEKACKECGTVEAADPDPDYVCNNCQAKAASKKPR